MSHIAYKSFDTDGSPIHTEFSLGGRDSWRFASVDRSIPLLARRPTDRLDGRLSRIRKQPRSLAGLVPLHRLLCDLARLSRETTATAPGNRSRILFAAPAASPILPNLSCTEEPSLLPASPAPHPGPREETNSDPVSRFRAERGSMPHRKQRRPGRSMTAP